MSLAKLRCTQLAQLLSQRTSINTSVEISGEDSLESLGNKMTVFSKNIKRINSIESKSKETFEKLDQYYQDLIPLFS